MGQVTNLIRHQMKTLVFATANSNKVKEVQMLVSEKISLRSLTDIGCLEELPETHETIPENSLEKAQYVFDHYAVDCFAEDTGLEVAALGGQPGVHTAHYAGTRDPAANIALLLKNLEGENDRRAQFRTVITLIIDGEVNQFTGIVTGTIATAPKGNDGFGYDPVFIPEGSDRTFAEMTLEEKTQLSHRARAVIAMTSYLLTRF